MPMVKVTWLLLQRAPTRLNDQGGVHPALGPPGLIVRPPGPWSPARARRRWWSSATTALATTWRRAARDAATTASGRRSTPARGSRRPSAPPAACRTAGTRRKRCRPPPERSPRRWDKISLLDFAHSVLIKLALRQAAQLSLFIWKVNKRCTFTRDLIKEAPLIERKRKMPCTQRNRTQSVGTWCCRSSPCTTTTAPKPE